MYNFNCFIFYYITKGNEPESRNNLLNGDHFYKTVWEADNGYNIFERQENDKWIEKLGGEPTFEFDQVRINDPNSVLLFDPNRQVFVQLNEHDSNYGHSEDTLRDLYNGKWINDQEGIDNQFKTQNNNNLTGKK